MAQNDVYTLCIDSYTGLGGYADGSYLYRYGGEEDADYVDRQRFSSYSNYVRGMVMAATDPVFGDKVTRNYGSKVYESFCQNVDMRGTSLTAWINNVARMHSLLGNVFIIMDNVAGGEVSIDEAIEARQYPFLYYKLPNEVQDVQLGRHGEVSSITFALDSVEMEGAQYNSYRTISNGVQKDWYRGSEGTFIEIGEPILSSSLRVIMTGSEVLPTPPFYSICDSSRNVYNMNSEQRDLERTQAFSILQVPSSDPETAMKLGSKNVLYVHPEGSRDAKYVSPDSSILQVLGTGADREVVALKDQARNLGIRVVEKHYKSGTALSLDYAPSYSILSNLSELFEGIERKIEAMFMRIFGGEIGSTTINYNKDYSPSVDKLQEDYDLQTAALSLEYTDEQKGIIREAAYQNLKTITGMK